MSAVNNFLERTESLPVTPMEMEQNRSLRDPPRDHSYQHCSLYYCIIKHLGHGDNGHAYAAISKNGIEAVMKTHEGKQTQAFFDDLRAKLVAIKFARPDNLEGDLTSEIMILTRELTEANQCYTWCYDFKYHGSHNQWLALSFCNGGVLGQFVDRFPGAVNLGFQWHILCELIRGVLYIFWGIDGPDQTALQVGWPLLTHGDIFTCNLLLSTRSPSFGNYPSVVIADFGRAMTDEHPDPSSTSEAESVAIADGHDTDNWSFLRHVQSVSDDGSNDGSENDSDDRSSSDDDFGDGDAERDDRGVTYLGELTEDTRCIGVVLEDIQADVAETDVQGEVPTARQANMIDFVLTQFRTFRARLVAQNIGFLDAILEIAIEQREATYKPMPADAVAFLNAPKVSDRELLASIC
ncbi:hypothetical protein EJ03DRAFT_86903 [Teratosphaeria nubilosa]|uniref:Protein kinase domain-containing protein n=1 Tax=Teratosphaeria nubilosa TaxID=161662 RepID=A0A6G1L9Z8_9PEZI|nr:hypothetical protein EJ03DRAFT_86903 [Teratosphaeria nubilosa]